MYYCGLDVASMSSYVYVSDQQGGKVTSGEVATTKSALEARLRAYVGRGGLSVAVEAGNQTAWIYEVLVALGAQVTVVNPAQVKAIAQSRRKTDKIDAKILCDLLRMGGLPHPVHMPGRTARALRGFLAARRQLIAARTKLCNVVRGMLRQEGIKLPMRGLSTFRAWRALLARGYELAHLPKILDGYFAAFESLTHSIRDLNKEITQYERQDPRSARLRTIPRVGQIAAMTFLAAVDDVHRFPSSRKLVGYSGLAPSVRSSGERTEYGAITRQGRSELRAVFVQVAHGVAIDKRRSTHALRKWFAQVAKKRGKRTALVALARRMLVIAYRLLKDETDFDAGRLKRQAA